MNTTQPSQRLIDLVTQAINGLVTQNLKKSFDNSQQVCMYRYNGLKCFIGQLIPDEKYDIILESNSVDNCKVIEAASLETLSMYELSVMKTFQMAHDNSYDNEDMYESLKNLCEDTNIPVPQSLIDWRHNQFFVGDYVLVKKHEFITYWGRIVKIIESVNNSENKRYVIASNFNNRTFVLDLHEITKAKHKYKIGDCTTHGTIVNVYKNGYYLVKSSSTENYEMVSEFILKDIE